MLGMTVVITAPLMTDLQNQRLAAELAEQQERLRAYVRRRVANAADAEDIVQEVLYELVRAYRHVQPIEQLTAWLLRVARHRIIDRFRARARENAVVDRGADIESIEELDYLPPELPLPHGAGPEAQYAREALADAIEAAIQELPTEQREAFVAHEFEGLSFKELAAKTGVSVNTLLGRKHAAVLQLRERLRNLYEQFGQ